MQVMALRSSSLVGLLLAAVFSFWTSRAGAQSARTHDGFYLRLGVGGALLTGKVDGDDIPLVGDAEGRLHGPGAAFELALGVAVSPGLILGVGAYGHAFDEPTAKDVQVGQVDFPDVEYDSMTLTILGLFLDYYVNEHQGFHLQGAIGFAFLAVGDAQTADNTIQLGSDHDAGGVGLMLGLGYEWWVSSAWGLGFLGRLSAAAVAGEGDNNVDWRYQAVVPALLFTATFN